MRRAAARKELERAEESATTRHPPSVEDVLSAHLEPEPRRHGAREITVAQEQRAAYELLIEDGEPATPDKAREESPEHQPR